MTDAIPRETEELRKEIAHIDIRLVAILDERARLARQLRDLRKNHAAAIPVGDHAAIRDLVERSSGEMPKDALREILREVFAVGLSLELPVKIAFVGPEGGAGHVAARRRFGLGDSSLLPSDTAANALEEVTRKRAEFAVVPFETSTEGPLQSTIVALMARDLRIVEMLDDESPLSVVNRSGRLSEMTQLVATPADQDQCRPFLDGIAATVVVAPVTTPKVACESAAADSSVAALANDAFAANFGLTVAMRDVRNTDRARIRYAVAGTRPSGRTGSEATSFVFSLQDASGALLDVLRVFAERGIGLTKIHSHPANGPNWSYLFYVEAAGHFTDRSLVTAFEEMKRMTRVFKLLGSYPAG